jgi:hypothetical protein
MNKIRIALLLSVAGLGFIPQSAHADQACVSINSGSWQFSGYYCVVFGVAIPLMDWVITWTNYNC